MALDQVSYVAPINGGGAFSNLTAPGIVVSDVSGAYTGRFAQTSDGNPLWQVARSDASFSQTALVDGFGNATVTTSNGAVAGTFNYTGAIDPDAGPGAYFGATGAAQLDSFSFNDLATGELIGEGEVIKGGEGTNGFGGGSGGDTLIARAKATTGQWQTTVTVKREASQLTAEQQQALIDSASNDTAAAGEMRVAAASAVQECRCGGRQVRTPSGGAAASPRARLVRRGNRPVSPASQPKQDGGWHHGRD